MTSGYSLIITMYIMLSVYHEKDKVLSVTKLKHPLEKKRTNNVIINTGTE